MKTKLSLFTLLLLSVLLFPACNDDDENIVPPPDASDYFPLEVGAFWVYETYSQMEGEEEVISSIDTLTVIDSYEDGDDLIYEISVSDNYLFKVFFPEQYRLSDGVLSAESGTLLLNVDEAQAGEIIRTDSIPQNLGSVDYRFLANTTMIESPAGTFECINFQGEISSTDPDQPINGKLINNYYAEGVGLIRANNYFFNSASLIGIRLVSFELP